MARAALVWVEGERLRLATVPESGEHLLGRTPGALVDLSDETRYDDYRTVSRRHALLRSGPSGFRLEHLSQSNHTRVNGAPIERPTTLADGDVILLGEVRLDFHDLDAAVRFTGPICPHCGRENTFTDQECWYCGTSLVNRRSEQQRRVAAQLRVVAADGARWDAYPDDVVLLAPGGIAVRRVMQLPVEATAGITVRDGHPILLQHPGPAPALVNGQPAADSHALTTGDEVRAAGQHVLVIIR